MKICHVNLANGYRGGERQTELLISYLEPYTEKQWLVCKPDSPLIDHLSNVKNLEFVTVKSRFQGHFRKINADFIQAHEGKAVHWAFIENFINKTPYLITRRVPQNVKKSFITTLCYTRAEELVAISSSICRYLKERFPSTRVTTINSAMSHMDYDSDEVDKLRKQYFGYFIVGHIGAYVDRHKGQRVIIEVARKFQNSNKKVLFLLLGTGSDEEVLKQESSDLDNIRWLGFHKNVGDYLKIFDLFVFPSRNEGLGSVLLDVMDYSVPIIASNVDGIPDLVKDGQTGLLIESGNAEDLYSKINLLMNNSELSNRLVQGAQNLIVDFSPEVMAQKYTELYKNLKKDD